MKILHTSDWHIGQLLKGESREEEHKKFFEWLINLIKIEKIDILLVAGDIFDVANPSNSALKLYYDFLFSLKELNLKKVIIVGGNHDGISTLETPKKILQFLNIETISGEKNGLQNKDIIFNIDNQVLICAIPFLRDGVIRSSIEKGSFSDIESALKEGIKGYYNSIFEEAKKIDKNIPIIAIGHFTILGGENSDSEREIYIGKLEGIKKESFEKFDYLAMGHLHKFQKISTNIYYSGSPIPFSFSESNQIKKVIIFDTESKNIETKDIPKFRELYRIKGEYFEVIESLKEIEKEELPPFVEITLQNKFVEQEQIEKLENLEFNGKILQINYENEKESEEKVINIKNLDEITTLKVFEERLKGYQIEDKEVIIETFKKIEELVNEDS